MSVRGLDNRGDECTHRTATGRSLAVCSVANLTQNVSLIRLRRQQPTSGEYLYSRGIDVHEKVVRLKRLGISNAGDVDAAKYIYGVMNKSVDFQQADFKKNVWSNMYLSYTMNPESSLLFRLGMNKKNIALQPISNNSKIYDGLLEVLNGARQLLLTESDYLDYDHSLGTLGPGAPNRLKVYGSGHRQCLEFLFHFIEELTGYHYSEEGEGDGTSDFSF